MALRFGGRAGRRSPQAASGGMRTKASTHEKIIPMPPMNPNWRKPRKSVSASDA